MIKCFSRKIENPCKLCIYKGLSSSFVPRPAFEYIKLGTIILNSKPKKNKAKYINNQ